MVRFAKVGRKATTLAGSAFRLSPWGERMPWRGPEPVVRTTVRDQPARGRPGVPIRTAPRKRAA